MPQGLFLPKMHHSASQALLPKRGCSRKMAVQHEHSTDKGLLLLCTSAANIKMHGLLAASKLPPAPMTFNVIDLEMLSHIQGQSNKPLFIYSYLIDTGLTKGINSRKQGGPLFILPFLQGTEDGIHGVFPHPTIRPQFVLITIR